MVASALELLGKRESVWNYILHVFTARLYLDQQDTKNAAKWLAVDRIELYDTLSESREFEHIVFARYLVQSGRTEEALFLLSRLEAFAQSNSRLISQIEVLCLQAISVNMMGDTENAMGLLHRALSLGAQDGYVRIFVDEGQPMLDLLTNYKSWAKQTGSKEHLEYSATLIKSTKEYLWEWKASSLSNTIKSSGNQSIRDSFSERELAVLKLLTDEFSNKDIADKLFITIRTVKYYTAHIYEKLGVSSRIEAIVKAKELGF